MPQMFYAAHRQHSGKIEAIHAKSYLENVYQNHLVVVLQIDLVTRPHRSRDLSDNSVPVQYVVVADSRPNGEFLLRLAVEMWSEDLHSQFLQSFSVGSPDERHRCQSLDKSTTLVLTRLRGVLDYGMHE